MHFAPFDQNLTKFIAISILTCKQWVVVVQLNVAEFAHEDKRLLAKRKDVGVLATLVRLLVIIFDHDILQATGLQKELHLHR